MSPPKLPVDKKLTVANAASLDQSTQTSLPGASSTLPQPFAASAPAATADASAETPTADASAPTPVADADASVPTPTADASTAAPTAASPSSKHLGVQNPAISKPRGWLTGGFGAYMSEKERKLREQFASEVDPAQATSVFAGVTVWVTGATKPPRTDIRRLLAENGGKFETYLSREKVTHVVADNLATATRRRMAPTPGKPSPYKIVTAQWVVNSARAGARKPEAEYAVPGMSDPGQKRVTAMFGPKGVRGRR